MDLTNIFSAQAKLDDLIHLKYNYDNSKIFVQKKLALLTELFELANEVKSFKYWSQNKKIDREKILFEYADGLHFIISIALNLKITKKDYFVSKTNVKYSDEYISNYFLLVSADFLLLNLDNPESCIKAIQSFLNLGSVIGLSEEEIEIFYFKKNLINYERLMNNY